MVGLNCASLTACKYDKRAELTASVTQTEQVCCVLARLENLRQRVHRIEIGQELSRRLCLPRADDSFSAVPHEGAAGVDRYRARKGSLQNRLRHESGETATEPLQAGADELRKIRIVTRFNRVSWRLHRDSAPRLACGRHAAAVSRTWEWKRRMRQP
jgi:hypothetical protein